MLTIRQERFSLIKIHAGGWVEAVIFAANGKYLVSGGVGGIRVWRVEFKDGKQMATLSMRADSCRVLCLAVSNDGKWIAAGTLWGEVIVWDAKTYEKVFSHRDDIKDINGVDFSPDSTQLVSASDNKTASIWDIAARKRVQTLGHKKLVTAAKYSPQGDRIATATDDCVRVWDSNDGYMLAGIPVIVNPWYNTSLLWFNNHLFVVSDTEIKQFEASTGSAVSEWPVPNSGGYTTIALPKHGKFIAYSTQRTITFWDTVTHTQLGLIRHFERIRSFALSPDCRFLAIGGMDGKITINSLSYIAVRILSLDCGPGEQLSYSDHSSIGFNPIISSASHIPRTGYSDQ